MAEQEGTGRLKSTCKHFGPAFGQYRLNMGKDSAAAVLVLCSAHKFKPC